MNQTDNISLYYANEDDRAYGLAGMAVTIAAYDALDTIASISLDSDGPMVTFSNEYYSAAAPHLSPKSTWNALLRNFQLTSAMVLANVLSRTLIRLQAEPPQNIIQEILDAVRQEGRDTCALDDDEIEAIFSRTLANTRRIFGNPRLHPLIGDFARTLSRRRTLSGRELIEELSLLNL